MTSPRALRLVRGFRARRRRDAAGADGLLQPDLHLRRRALHRRRQGGRRRRPDRRRPAARGGRRAVPAGARGRARLHPPRHADHRRRAPAGGAAQHLGLRLLRLGRRHHRVAHAATSRQVASAVARIKRHTDLPVASASASRRPSMRGAIAGAPTAWWSARRWSRRCASRSTPRAAPARARCAACSTSSPRSRPARRRGAPRAVRETQTGARITIQPKRICSGRTGPAVSAARPAARQAS